MIPSPRTYTVSRTARAPLLEFIVGSLKSQGCTIIHCSEPTTAPFLITFELPGGERMGVVAYAFLATRTETKNRPKDERSFQVKYGSKESYHHDNSHVIWRDPLGLFTTIFLGISPDEKFFVAADPAMHNPTKFFIRIEFKDHHADQIKKTGWFAWERDRRDQDEPVEVLVGGTQDRLLDLIKFERMADRLDQGNRQLLAERSTAFSTKRLPASLTDPVGIDESALHPLVEEFKLSSDEILNVIANARRLKMAVRGWVAEEHLRDTLSKTAGVTDCERLDEDGSPDIRLRFKGGRPMTIECKNVLRVPDKAGNPRVDFQRTRASKADPCSRYYAPDDFDVVAACLHAVTERWEFRFVLPGHLPEHKKCTGKIASNVIVGSEWASVPDTVFEQINAIGASR
ncbi:hypothetical protein [Bradyrhizobium ottawaense]|uniref:hypothetical protein n=1 Tax=Bradyrhizobium ottawaense TaxID=931866 RepID=UPI0027D6AE05|nr:hypothetical protein BwSG10_41560 [Bradyrhizobium ottawaense]GMP03144.1 hypothetical protein BwSH20_37960 [Bradyrhizobium ottawaense]GMP03284.1 hypothetical protein BwDG23_41560 [Bradyrhizobium ottawaense]GMP15337.1 hypothetical protein BwSH12_13390 [Bradyrhizobium ottawaense]